MKTKLKQTKGITLIALIITIIILLILAMVTIRILMNQGIIKHAENATEAYNNAQNNETEYLTYAEGEMDKYAGASGSGSGSGDSYTPPAEDVDALRKYFLGANEEGQSLMNLYGENGFKDDEATIGSGSNISLLPLPLFEGDEIWYYVVYKNEDTYRLVLDQSSYNTKDLIFVYHPQGAEGEKRQYKGEDWTVLYDKGDTLELVSPKTIGDHVGIDDENATGSTDIEIAIDSYNNAITRLNSYCRTTLSDNTARCFGSNSNSPDSDNPGMYTSNDLASWESGTYNGKGKKADYNFEQDIVRVLYHERSTEITNSQGNSTSYYIAGRYICQYVSGSTTYGTCFCVRYVESGGYVNSDKVWTVTSDDGVHVNLASHGVRACVTVNK